MSLTRLALLFGAFASAQIASAETVIATHTLAPLLCHQVPSSMVNVSNEKFSLQCDCDSLNKNYRCEMKSEDSYALLEGFEPYEQKLGKFSVLKWDLAKYLYKTTTFHSMAKKVVYTRHGVRYDRTILGENLKTGTHESWCETVLLPNDPQKYYTCWIRR